MMPGVALLRGPQGGDRQQTGPLGAQVGGDRSGGGVEAGLEAGREQVVPHCRWPRHSPSTH